MKLNCDSDEFRRDLQDADNALQTAPSQASWDEVERAYLAAMAQFASLQLQATLDLITLVKGMGTALEGSVKPQGGLSGLSGVGEAYAAREIPAGYCGVYADHDGHVMENASVGTYRCTGRRSDAEPGRSERKRADGQASQPE